MMPDWVLMTIGASEKQEFVLKKILVKIAKQKCWNR
jgi:hypothetical protein